MPKLRPFRALRFDAQSTQLDAVLAPPYDIISPAQRRELLLRDPHNAVRLDLPADVGSADRGDYRAAAQTLAAWRRDGVLVKDEHPTVTVHQMTWTDAEGHEAEATGFFARLRLEPFGSESGILPHESTHQGPKQDRYELLRATQLNTSPIVLLAGSDSRSTTASLAALTRGPADATATTSDGVSHRLWICDGEQAEVVELLDLVSPRPLTIADGHHRYETALQYRDDNREPASDDGESARDYVMVLVYPLDEAPPALPTHRVISGGPVGEALFGRLAAFGSIEAVSDRDTLVEHMLETVTFAAHASGTGRVGVFSGGRAAILTLDPAAVGAHLEAGLSAASRGLDVNALSAIIEDVYGSDAASLVGLGRLVYVKDAHEATDLVIDAAAGACFLLDRMPASAITHVAEAGEVMPQKSTYFNPKAPTGLMFSPLEW